MRYIEPDLLEKANQWLTPVFDLETQQKIKDLIAYDTDELNDSFYKDLAFGTGGMRGVMGVGTNRINKYTLGRNTQGISNYLKQQFPGEDLKVVIAYDCRHNSKALAEVVANVFSANGIEVFLFFDLRPTPELSFAVRYLNCHCGIVLTASHNPPEYNGYKVYWQDGGQLVPPQDGEIIQEINQLQYADIQFDGNELLINRIDKDVDNAFAAASIENGNFDTSDKTKKELKIVFTSLHGTSITMVPRVLKEAGYTNLYIVEEQAEPDGDFPTVKSPNPEEPAALKMAIDLALQNRADIVIGTDPDCDRLGIAVRNGEGKMVLLNGNQTMVLMTDFLLKQHQKKNTLQSNAFVASTIVSTPMMLQLAAHYNVECKLGLTGFKWIAKMIKDYPNQQFIGGGEESFGYMVGDFVRDKDAVTATLLACEMAAQQKERGATLLDYLDELYAKHGFYKEHLISIVKKGIEGAEEIKQMMTRLREQPLTTIGGAKVVGLYDYESSTYQNTETGVVEHIDFPKSNVLLYETEDGSRVAARPSGTEPKIKFYISVCKKPEDIKSTKEAERELDEKLKLIIRELNA